MVATMVQTIWGIVREKKIEISEDVNLPDGARALVILLTEDDESQFWVNASQSSIDAVWNNAEDDVYAQLFQK